MKTMQMPTRSARLAAACGLAMAFALGSAGARAADPAPSAQNNRMAACSADFKASGQDGKERQAFMKDCLTDKKKAQNNKMSSCSADFKASGKDGKERQAFMKECLSAKPAA
ncbi:MAG: PsiF family protein [Xylophilus ampelinus]